jgi:hypothetical protein
VITVSVWGVPLPVRKGEEFTVKIGAKCSANCSLAGLAFAVHDHQGNLATRGELGDELLPMTSDLRWSEQKLVAPAEAGLYKWVVECPAPELELPHEVPSASFTFKAVDPPDHVVTVEVIDRDRKTLLKNASIFMHPYRGNTDEQGIGRIEIGKGQHELYVKKQDYVPFQTTVQVDEDVTVRVELMWSPDPYVF